MNNREESGLLMALRCVLAFAAISTSSLGQATPSVTAETTLLLDNAIYQYPGVPVHGTVASSVGASGQDYSQSASASSRYGVVKAFAAARHSSMNQDPYGFYGAAGTAGFTDDITIAYYDGVTGVELYHGLWVTVALDYFVKYSINASMTGGGATSRCQRIFWCRN